MTFFRHKYRVESARKNDHDYSQPGFYFVTICTRKMRCTLGSISAQKPQLSEIGGFVETHWHEIHSHYSTVELDEFVIMPNHVHGIIRITGLHGFSPDSKVRNAPHSPALGTIVGGFKSGVSRWCREKA